MGGRNRRGAVWGLSLKELKIKNLRKRLKQQMRPNSRLLAKTLAVNHCPSHHGLSHHCPGRGFDERPWRFRLHEPFALTIRIDLLNQGLEGFFRLVVIHLAGACIRMATTVVVQHQITNVGAGCSPENRLTDGKDRILLA